MLGSPFYFVSYKELRLNTAMRHRAHDVIVQYQLSVSLQAAPNRARERAHQWLEFSFVLLLF